jgi:hypothetical protein
LTGRAEELEQEATELRRENNWLKEIVVLKGARLAAAQSTNRGETANSSPAGEDDIGSDEDTSGDGKAAKGKGRKSRNPS